MKYLFNKQFNSWIDEEKTIRYSRCRDGIAINAGTLLGSGFEPSYLSGLTLPEEVNGIPVTELNGVFRQGEIGYIESAKLKRIDINVIVEMNSYGDKRCSFPVLCGGLQNTLQSIRIAFSADKAHIDPIEDPAVRSTVEYVGFDGIKTDDPDWDFGSFQSGLFEGCINLKDIHGRFEGYCLTGRTFKDCISLVSLPEIRVKNMGEREFLNCTSLGQIRLHDGLKTIGYECFKNCRSLRDVYLPDTLDSVGADAFSNCGHLVIHGKTGTLAERYAKDHQIEFVAD
ncbi:MAG: leucine-rich repeat domain-containing protein [Lachnospiraceae bacterium]|nr:leucine-rich repeat domain-containing protein [Lachnospiraceae bacterium]